MPKIERLFKISVPEIEASECATISKKDNSFYDAEKYEHLMTYVHSLPDSSKNQAVNIVERFSEKLVLPAPASPSALSTLSTYFTGTNVVNL